MATISPNTASAALKALFDRQMEMAVKLAGDETGIKALFPLLEQIGQVTEGEGRIPFAIIPQNPNLTLPKRMIKVVFNDRYSGSCTRGLDYPRIIDLDVLPRGHYLAVDIEDGQATQNIKPSVCLAQFKQDNRLGGTAVEGITVVTYDAEILRRHYINLTGSCRRSEWFTILFLDDGTPMLGLSFGNNAHPHSGSLSCGRRLGLGA